MSACRALNVRAVNLPLTVRNSSADGSKFIREIKPINTLSHLLNSFAVSQPDTLGSPSDPERLS